jgi:hypothetical protein
MRRLHPVFLLLVALGAACQPVARRRPRVEEVLFERRTQGIKGLIAAARDGRLIPFDEVLVVVHDDLVQGLVEATLPYEQTLAERYRVRAESANVTFEDGFALVQLRGRASLLQDVDTAAEIDVYGAIDIVELDPATGVLRGRVKILGVETQRVDLAGIPAPVRRLVDDLSREQLSAFEPLLSNIEIPVKLEQTLSIPAVNQAGIKIQEAVLPMEAAVVDVKAFRGKLWVCVKAKAQIAAGTR